MSGPKRTEPSRHLYAGHVYTPAASTDLRARFAAVREQMQPVSTKNVATLKQRKVK